MAASRPERWREGGGEGISARRLNLMVDAIMSLMDLFGMGDGPRYDARTRQALPFGIRVGKVVAKGPSNAPDWTDERYWIQEHAITSGASAFAPVVLEKKPDIVLPNPTGGDPITIPQIVVVSNVAELFGHTHGLPVDTVVLFVGFFDTASPIPNTRYLTATGGGVESAPEFQGDVHVGTANGVAGWAPMPVTNYVP